MYSLPQTIFLFVIINTHAKAWSRVLLVPLFEALGIAFRCKNEQLKTPRRYGWNTKQQAFAPKRGKTVVHIQHTKWASLVAMFRTADLKFPRFQRAMNKASRIRFLYVLLEWSKAAGRHPDTSLCDAMQTLYSSDTYKRGKFSVF